MKTLEKLELVNNLIKKSEEILNEILKNPENDSLTSYYGYTLKLIKQELNILSDNSHGYLTRDKSIEDVINAEGDEWNDESSDDGSDIEDIMNDLI